MAGLSPGPKLIANFVSYGLPSSASRGIRGARGTFVRDGEQVEVTVVVVVAPVGTHGVILDADAQRRPTSVTVPSPLLPG
jgi:hypothetical protein